MTLVAEDGARPSPSPTWRAASRVRAPQQSGRLAAAPRRRRWSDAGCTHARKQLAAAQRAPGPRTMTREAHSASKPACAAGGATSVPSDHSATPASSTREPPILRGSGALQCT